MLFNDDSRCMMGRQECEKEAKIFRKTHLSTGLEKKYKIFNKMQYGSEEILIKSEHFHYADLLVRSYDC